MAGVLLRVVVINLLISLTITAPSGSRNSKEQAHNGVSKFSDELAYEYKYTAKAMLSLPGSGGHPRTLETSCKVAIQPVSATHRRMQVADCLLFESSDSKMEPHVSHKLGHDDKSLHDIIFTMGSDEIQAHPKATPISLSLQRAILSLITPNYMTISEDGSHNIQTKVHLQTCSNIAAFSNHLFSRLIQNSTEGTWSGTEVCDYRSRAGQLKEVNCHEQLTLSTDSPDAGFTIRTNQSLVLIGVSPYTNEGSLSSQSNPVPSNALSSKTESQKQSEGSGRTLTSVKFRKRVARSLRLDNPSAPSTYTAMLMGQNHIVTWDGRVYTLPDFRTHRCAYQLARDTQQHNFTLLQTRDMVEVITHTMAVRVRRDGRVLVNRASTPSDLPVQSPSGDLAVTRRGPYVQVTTTFGLSLRFDTETDNTLISLSGRYHGRSRGLLGTNDGRSHNDFSTRQGDVTHKVHTFIESYEVSSRPECHPQEDSPDLRRSSPLCDNGMDARCDMLFKDQASTLSSCLGSTDPEPFRMACLTEVRRCYRSPAEATTNVCRLAAAYTALCREKGQSAHMPTLCSACGNHPVGTTWSQLTQSQVDAVIVVAGRIGPAPSLLMHQLATNLNTGSAPFDLRVGVVTAGGKGLLRHAHSHTFDGSLFSHRSDPRLMAHLETGRTSHPRHTVRGALHLAADYPFRPAAVKVVLLVTDTDSQEDLSSLTHHLKSRGIVVNVVGPYRALQSPTVVGLDHTGELLTTATHSQPLTAHIPTKSYAQLAVQTEGLLLDPRAFSDDHRPVLGRALRDQAARQGRDCRRCTCRLHQGIHSISTCLKVVC